MMNPALSNVHPAPAAGRSRRRAFTISWFAVTLTGELLAVAFVALTVATTFGGAVLAALFEGTVLGMLQFRVLRGLLPQPALWIAATVGGTVLGRSVEYLLDNTPAVGVFSHMAGLIPLLLGIPLGVAIGAMLAAPQWFVLRGHGRDAWKWPLVTAIAWAVAFPLGLIGAGSVDMRAGDAAFLMQSFAIITVSLAVVASLQAWVLGYILLSPRDPAT